MKITNNKNTVKEVKEIRGSKVYNFNIISLFVLLTNKV